MNTIKCPKCSFENTFGLVFCTSCGTSLYGARQETTGGTPTVERKSPQAPDTLSFSNAQKPKSNTRTFLIVGAVATVLLLTVGAVALSGFFYYLGTRNRNTNSNSNVDIASAPNKNTNSLQTNANLNTSPANGKKSPDYDDTDIEANPITLPPAVGPFEQQGTIVGSGVEDYVGADEVTKATYSKNGKEVEFILAKFSDRLAAKTGYEEFLKGLRSSGARLIAKQKVKNKSGVATGDAAIFTFEKKWNALLYIDKHGARFIAPDRYTLLEFAREFDKLFSAK
ncbi:MAG: hypothetical protein HOP17_01920 [Acidobacteria bacterium]|nr:hypothetical protein [Acidobacteriota bacterium]